MLISWAPTIYSTLSDQALSDSLVWLRMSLSFTFSGHCVTFMTGRMFFASMRWIPET